MHSIGWATKRELQRAVVLYDGYPDRTIRPRHLADVFTATKLYVSQSRYIWAPHADAKVRFSAYEMLVFAVHSLDCLRPFIPTGVSILPNWWMAWKTHVQVFYSVL